MSALRGIRVLDLTFFQQGPSAAALLGAMGADVIKIEQPGVGDPGRGVMTGYSSIHGTPTDQRNFYFEAYNRNKRGMTLNLSRDEGRGILCMLVQTSDVFVHNLRQQAVAKLGITYEALRCYNPQLIYASASGYGPEGEDTDLPSLDPAALARSGFLSALSEPGKPPAFVGMGLSDQVGALTLANGILMALVARERQGIGQEIAASLLGGMIWVQCSPLSYTLTTGLEREYHDRRKANNPLFNSYQCSDGHWLLLAGMQADRIWPHICEALDITHLQNHPDYRDTASRNTHKEVVIGTLDHVFAGRTRQDWLQRFRSYGDIICAPIQTPAEVIRDRQVVQNGYVMEYDHPSYGNSRVIGYPIHASKTPLAVHRSEPEFGQHTEEILIDIGGYTWEEVERFRETGVIWSEHEQARRLFVDMFDNENLRGCCGASGAGSLQQNGSGADHKDDGLLSVYPVDRPCIIRTGDHLVALRWREPIIVAVVAKEGVFMGPLAGKARVLSPRADAKARRPRTPLAPRLGELKGKVIGLVENHRPNADVVADTLAAILKGYGVRDVLIEHKDGPSYGMRPDQVTRLLQNADAIVYGLASWGACTSGGVRHTVEFETKGIPSVLICIPDFEKRAHMQAEGDGIPDLHIVPLSRDLLGNAYADSTDAAPFIAKAVEAAAPDIVSALAALPARSKEATWATPQQ